MVHLPNLNDLILSGDVIAPGYEPTGLSLGLGAGLRGRFGGELQIKDGHTVSKRFVDMLLEVPTGLHFTKVCIHVDFPGLPQTVRLAEACCRTLVDLSYSCSTYSGKSHPFRSPGFTSSSIGTLTLFTSVGDKEFLERSFDFSKFPRLQTVTHWTDGPLHYIHTALSTLKPPTSPHLSHVHLRFTGPEPGHFYFYLNCRFSGLEELGSDLRRIADGLSRIEREYKGVVNLRVFRVMGFKVLDTLNVRFSFLWGWTRPHYEIVGSLLAGPSALGSLR